MEIRVIPSKLKKHINDIDEEIRIAHEIDDMISVLFKGTPYEKEILQSAGRICDSIERRKVIMENLETSIQEQENWCREYIEYLKRM